MTREQQVKVGLIIAFVLSFGYCIGYHNGSSKVMKMYDEHINRQWDMIQKRDSFYVNALQLKLNYKDGHILTPEK